MNIEPTIGRNVRRIRLEQGLSQAALAEAVGVATRHIGRIEQGTISATIGLLARLADALHCEIGDLIEDRDVPMPPNLPRGRAVAQSTDREDADADKAASGLRGRLGGCRPSKPNPALGKVPSADLRMLERILFKPQEGTLCQAAEQMVSSLIEQAGGEENLSPAQRRNIELARAWAAAKDSGELNGH